MAEASVGFLNESVMEALYEGGLWKRSLMRVLMFPVVFSANVFTCCQQCNTFVLLYKTCLMHSQMSYMDVM